jgi:hypothetical protein
MDILVTSTGKTFYQVDATIGFLLLEAFPESFKQACRGPHADPRAQVQPPAASVVIGLNKLASTGEPFVQATDNRSTLKFKGESKDLVTFDFWLCGKANHASKELVAAYRAARIAFGYPEDEA